MIAIDCSVSTFRNIYWLSPTRSSNDGGIHCGARQRGGLVDLIDPDGGVVARL
jgi:hypothetical protein